jgi:PAS domain S-box-containing protein
LSTPGPPDGQARPSAGASSGHGGGPYDPGDATAVAIRELNMDSEWTVSPPSPEGSAREVYYPVFDASPNPVVAVDSDARITYVNEQVGAAFGYTRAELIGQLVEVLLPERVAARHVAHRDRFIGHPVARPMGIGLDLAGRRKDGTEFPVEISLSPVQTAQGLHVFATVVDITARKAMENALAESEHRFRAVLEASPNAVVAVDASARITYVNPRVQATFGYTREELLGEPVEKLLPERVAARHVTHRDGFIANPVARPMGIGLDLAGRRKDGTEFPVEISLSPVPTSAGTDVFATVVDITARKAMENQLLQALKLESIGRLAGGIAHDFNNMLFAIRGYTELLEEDLAGETIDREEAGRNVAAIADAADRAATLTAQLLAFSRQQVVSPRELDLNEAVRSVEPMTKRLIGEHIDLRMHLEAGIGGVRIDPGQLDQILINLVINARDAMPEGGTITIETANAELDQAYAAEHIEVVPGPYVMLAVSDTGVGMEREVREHIFEPFFTTKELGKGTGLGLATIYGIVRQSSGHIWLYSEPGHGTAFKLYFPRATPDGEDAPPPAPSLEPEASAGRILVVEDEPTVRTMTSRYLERAGYRVTAVDDGEQALAAIEALREPIDVLVSDVIMPNMSGIKLAEQVLERYPGVGLVLLSGYTAETLDLERVTSQGAIFLAKPSTGAQLLDAVRRAKAARSSHGEPG